VTEKLEQSLGVHSVQHGSLYVDIDVGAARVARTREVEFHSTSPTWNQSFRLHCAYPAATITFTVKNATSASTPTTPTKPTTPTTPAPTTGYPSLGGFQLIDTTTGKVIKGYEKITGGTTIKLSSLPTRKLALVAIGTGGTQSIKLTAMGKTRVDSDAPYAFLGMNGTKYNSFYAWAGNYSFSATAYGQDGATGTKGQNITLKIKFT
jgi:hypothetical protein